MIRKWLRVALLIIITLHLLFFSVVLLFLICTSPRDWSYPICNGYEITKFNSKNICVTKNDGGIIIDGFVFEYFCERQIAGFKNLNKETSSIEYYLLSTLDGELFGPMYEEELFSFAQKINVDVPNIWNTISPSGITHH